MNNVINAITVALLLIVTGCGIYMMEETGAWFPLLMMVTTVIFYTLSVIELVQSTKGNK
jgi:hypothetical protein